MLDDDVRYRPWGTVSPAFWTEVAECVADPPSTAPLFSTPPSAAPPDSIRVRLDEIAAAADSGHLDDATALAHVLEEQITAEYGGVHLYTAHICEVRAHLAHVAEDRPVSLELYLHATRLRAMVQGPGHPDTLHAASRVHGLWRTLADPDSSRLREEVLTVLRDIHGPAGTSSSG